MLHLHRTHDEEGLARTHGVALGNGDLDDRALQECAHGAGPGGLHGVPARCGGRLLPVGEHRQRIAGIDARAEAAAPNGFAHGSGRDFGTDCCAPRPGMRRDPRRLVRQFLAVPLQEPGVDPVRDELRVAEQRTQEGEVRAQARDPELVESAGRAGTRVGEARPAVVADHLREQRVEGRVRCPAGARGGVGAHAPPRGRLEDEQRTDRRSHRSVGIDRLRVHPHLDRVSARARCGGESQLGEGATAGDLELRAHQVDSEHLLGDRVLDLQARIRLDERPAGALVEHRRARLDQELEGPRAAETQFAREAQGRLDQARAQPRCETRAGRDLDELLVAALDAALALPEGDRRRPVAEHLHLDVPRRREQDLDVETIVAKGGPRFGPAAQPGRVEFVGRAHDAHAAPAAAGERLHDDRRRPARRPGDRGREEAMRFLDGDRSVATVEKRDAAACGERARARLVAERVERRGVRTDEGDARGLAAPGESRVFCEEPVAGMDRVTAGLSRDGDDALAVEVGCGAGACEGARLVGAIQVRRGGVVGRVDGDRRDAEFRRSAQDARRDLPSIGDQELPHRNLSPAANPRLERRPSTLFRGARML